MKDLRNFFKHLIQIMFSNAIGLFVGLISSFIIPMVLTKTDFGYYKIFYLYSAYIPLLHFGFVDGISLKFSGLEYYQLDKYKIRTYTLFFFTFEFIIFILLMLLVTLININHIYKLIVIYWIFNSFLSNIFTYYQFIFRATFMFKSISIINIIQSVITIIMLFISLILYFFGFFLNMFYYLFMTDFVVFVIVIIYIFNSFDITFGYFNSFKKEFFNIKNFFKSGFILMMSYQASQTVINLDNQFISFLFKSSLYAEYTFAYSMSSIVSSILSSISIILLPYMKKNKDTDKVLNFHEIMVKYLSIIIFTMLILYYPFIWIINNFLHRYITSLIFLRIVFSNVSISCIVLLILFNFFNYLNKSKIYLKINLFNISFSSIIYFLTYILWKSTIMMAYSSILSMLIWLFCLEIYFYNNYNMKFLKNYFYLVIMILIFLISTSISKCLISIFIYITLYSLTTTVFYGRSINKSIKYHKFI